MSINMYFNILYFSLLAVYYFDVSSGAINANPQPNVIINHKTSQQKLMPHSGGNKESDKKVPLKKIYIGALFPMNGSLGWLGGQGCLPAAKMALNDVNRNASLLVGYELDLKWNNSQCDPGLGTAVLYDLIYTPPIKTIILGGCSIVCTTIAETAKMYNLIVVGYGSSSPALSNRTRFTTFFRTHPSATIHNPTRLKLFKKFKWSKIAIILEAEELFVTTGQDLEAQCKNADIEIITRVSFLDDPSEAVKSLYRQGARIIVGMFYSGAARKVMCEAYKAGLYGKQYVWFLIGWYEENWYHPVTGTNCTMSEMLKVVEGHFTTEALMLNQGHERTYNGMTASEWLSRYERKLSEPQYREWFPPGATRPQEGYQEAPLAYDAIWAIALALNKTINNLEQKGIAIESFNYESVEITNMIKSELQNVKFLGVSGSVVFDESGSRISRTQIEQMIDGKYNILGYYDTTNDDLTWLDMEVWKYGRPPRDMTEIVAELITVNNALFITLSAISAIGVLMAISLICFNRKFVNYRYIQMSNPTSNNMMLFGCVLCFVSVILFGLDGRDVGIHNFIMLCNARASFLSIGFSLFFGAMFSKIWFCHLLHTQAKRKKVNNTYIYIMIYSFCFIDIIILTIWFFKDPMYRRMELLPLRDPDITDEDIKIEPRLEHCEANYIWYGILFGYKGLLLLFGLFLSYETRSVKLKQMNDSRLVGMSIYNVVILCVITGPISLVISNQVDSHFAFIALAIIFCCFLSMALIFVPKIVELVRRRSGPKGLYGSHTNGTFHETMTSREEEEKFKRLTLENDELKEKIAEKERLIEQVKSKIDQISKQQQELRKQEEKTHAKQHTKKAVRIQEPDFDERDAKKDDDRDHLNIISIDPVSDSGFVSTRNSRPSDFEFSESYL